VRLEQRCGVVRIHLDPRAAHVDERVRARGVVAEAGRELERSPSPAARLLAVVGQHRQLRDPAAGPGELDRLAQWLQDRDRLDGLGPGRAAVAGEPVEARELAGAPAQRRMVAELAVDVDRIRDRLEGLVDAADDVGGGGELFEQIRLLDGRQLVDEVAGPPVVPVRLAVRLERRGSARGDQRVLTDHFVGPGRLRVVHDVRRVGVRGQERAEDIRVKPPSRGGRDGSAHGVPGELVAEANVPFVQLEQLPALGLLGRRGPAGHHGVEDRGAHAVRHHRHELHQAPRVLVQPRDAGQDRVRDGWRGLGGVARREQLGHVERVAAGRRVDLVRVLTRERGDGVAGQGKQLDQGRVLRPDRAERRVERMTGRGLARAVRRHEQGGQGADAPAQHGQRVERGVVGPVHVLEHQHRRPRRSLELLDQQVVDLVRRRAGRQRVREAGRDAAREIAERPQRARDRQVVAGARENARAAVEIVQEAPHQGGLPDPGLAADADGPPFARCGRCVCLGERLQRGLTLKKLHADSRHVGTYGVKHR
jgi:hypothetical protein